MQRLKKDFYLRTDVVQIAQDLLGKYLVSNFDGQKTIARIVETEAYRAPDDKACHAYQDLRTERTKIMFEEGGVVYIYLCYGTYHLFNVVTAPKDVAHAILIRGVEPVENTNLMLERRKMTTLKRNLTGGPGLLSQALGFHKNQTGISLLKDDSLIWIEDRGDKIDKKDIIASPRVGVDYAEECAFWDWRFRVKNSTWTSPAK